MAAIVATRRALGKEADDVIAAIRNNAKRLRAANLALSLYDSSADFDEGLADYLGGNRAKGLRLMKKAASDGYFVPLGHPYLKAIYDDPGFAPIREIHGRRQLEERTRFLAAVCTDKPFAEVWRPRTETCEPLRTTRRSYDALAKM